MIHICAPRAPIRCHALTTLRASRRHMAQHDKIWEVGRKSLGSRQEVGSNSCLNRYQNLNKFRSGTTNITLFREVGGHRR